ncbi:hypothetical protein BKA65DRAFT_496765 [Rhexocercosporidium sp. MPI-PUGE-AT-0058]|nr:hypothetical protein BKA65DRAFT_496765 [Rhexocercosporidium sp. MPI-PUGE-AT-0058]
MDTPLSVIEDEHGRLRDIHDRPMVLIFSSKPRRLRTSCSSEERPARLRHKKFEFINVVKPGDVSEESRHIIKTHVMQDVRSRQRERSKTTLPPPPSRELCPQKFISPTPFKIPPEVSNDGPPFLGFPVPMQPYMRKLLHQYSTSIMHISDPKHPANPIDSAWFPMFMTDAALFHAVLCTSAIWIRLLSGGTDEVSQGKHMLEAISLINIRLRSVDISDATITTILFLAKAEYTQKNPALWNVHMNGMKKIVEMRGGIHMLPDLIRQKIYDAELLGSLETGSVPRFHFINNSAFGSSETPRLISDGFAQLAECHILQGELLGIFREIEEIVCISRSGKFTTALFETAMFPIRYRLFCWTGEGGYDDQPSAIHQCLHHGAIIYVQSLLRKPPVRGFDLSVLSSRLKNSMLQLESCGLALDGLLIWLSLVGGISADGIHREWFTKKLRGLTTGIDSWNEVRIYVGQYWWVDQIHDLLGKQLWSEVKRSSSDET